MCCRAPLPVLAWCCLLLSLAVPLSVGQQLTQQQAQPVAGSSAFDNVVPAEPTTQWQGGASCGSISTAIRIHAIARLSGSALIPFTTELQKRAILALQETIMRDVGPAELANFREFYPDPGAPDGIRENSPGVELTIMAWYLNKTTNDWQDSAYKSYSHWLLKMGPGGAWALSSAPLRTVHSSFGRVPCPRGYVLQPLLVLSLMLKFTPSSSGERLLSEQASAAAEALESAVVGQRLGSLVEVVGYSQPAGKVTTLVQVEVTLYKCRSNATVPSPECERRVLAEVLQSAAVQQQWEEAGLKNMTVLSIQQRQPPPPPSAARQQQKDWVPWHLDRLDQRALPLDGSFSASASGSGVNVYLVSTGVRGDHAEFEFMDGTPGTRVQAGWAVQGLNPLLEEPSGANPNGFGTYAASICCGLKVGVAKNATIHSVRFQEVFMLQPSSWSEGGLPAALDFVLSTHQKPAVVLIYTLWVPGRVSGNDSAIVTAILLRLDKLQKANLTVVAPALGDDPCVNIIASHPGVISVAGTDVFDQAVAFASRNATCIDMWAPSGGVGFGMVGAQPSGPSNYTRVITKGYGAAALVAGLAAQLLQQHPDATGSEVRRALLESASNHTVTGAGISPTLMAFTNLTQASVAAPPAASSGSDAALSTGAIVGIAVGATVACLGVALAIFLVHRLEGKRDEKERVASTPPEEPGWQVPLSDIELEKQADGSPHLLGTGRYGPVYKAVKGGVQVVAVKEVQKPDKISRAELDQEIALLKTVSRDANIVQFYGACTREDKLLIIMEYMEEGDLLTAIASGGEALQWYNRGQELMLDVVRGLVFLHRSGVVHRDISSKNVLLGRNGQAKLSDVGLAQLLKQVSPVGALPWAAPEVLLGAKVTEKADVYSLGVVLWELVTREVPQRGCMRDPEVPRECPQGVADAIWDCMRLDPAARPSTKELFDRLSKCKVARSPDSSLGRPLKAADRERSLIVPLDSAERGGQVGRLLSDESLPATALGPDIRHERESSQLSGSLSSGVSTEREGIPGVVAIDFPRIEFCIAPDGSRRQLGSGAYGAVYRVLLDGVQPLAAKEIQLGAEEGIHSVFTKEAEILWRLRHRNIVTLCGVSISKRTGYLLMELMEGGSLFDQLNLRFKHSRERVFGWYRRGAALILDIARGLHYIHSMRVSHFDIKSNNVLLTRDLNAKIVDVGLSRLLTCTHHSFESGTSFPGTFPYMAPELLAGVRCTQSVDIFAMGVLMWEILSGEHPVRGCMRPLEVPEECPQGVVDLMRDCLHINPAQRPTARQLVQRLTAISSAKPAPSTSKAEAALGVGASADAAHGPVLQSRTEARAGQQRQMVQGTTNPQVLPVPLSPFTAMREASLPLSGSAPSAPAEKAPTVGTAEPEVRQSAASLRAAPATQVPVSPFAALRAGQASRGATAASAQRATLGAQIPVSPFAAMRGMYNPPPS